MNCNAPLKYAIYAFKFQFIGQFDKCIVIHRRGSYQPPDDAPQSCGPGPLGERIATPVFTLARNDIRYWK